MDSVPGRWDRSGRVGNSDFPWVDRSRAPSPGTAKTDGWSDEGGQVVLTGLVTDNLKRKAPYFPGKIDGFLSVFPKKYSELPIEFAQFLWQDPRNHIQMVKNVRYQNSPRRRPTSPLRSIFLGGSIIHIQMQKWIFTYSIPPSTDSWYWSQQITIFSYVLIFSHIFSLPNRPNTR